MEALLFYIFLLVTYIAYKLKFLFFPVINKWAGYEPKRLKGKFLQSDFLVLPSDFDSSSQLSHEVTQRGMATKLEIFCVAQFDTLHSKNDFLQGKLTLIRTEFFQNQNFGKYGIVAVKYKYGDSVVEAGLDCSPASFDLVINELQNERAVLIRVLGHQVKGGGCFSSANFHILTSQSISGPKYFVEKYVEHVSKWGGLSQEKFAELKEKFQNAVQK